MIVVVVDVLRTVPKTLEKRFGELNHITVKISSDTEKCPGNLRNFTVIQNLGTCATKDSLTVK